MALISFDYWKSINNFDSWTGYTALLQRGCPGGGIRLVQRNQEEEKISSEIFDADVEEPPAQEKGATLLLQRVD